MIAYLVEWGWFKLGTYGLMMALGFLCAWAILRNDLIRKGIDPALAAAIAFNTAIWGVIGARVLSLIEEPGRFAANPIRTLLLEGGLTWYGGLVAAAAAAVYTIVKARAPMLSVFDSMTPAAFVGYAFGRVGCLLSGDGCYGKATSLPWGMSFPKLPDEPGFHCMRTGAIANWPPPNLDTPNPRDFYPEDVLVHPTPIYEALAALALFGVLWLLRRRIERPGVMIGLFFVLSAFPRFFIEFIRLNARHHGLSMSQWISIGALAFGIALIARAFLAPPQAAVAPAAPRKPRGKRVRG